MSAAWVERSGSRRLRRGIKDGVIVIGICRYHRSVSLREDITRVFEVLFSRQASLIYALAGSVNERLERTGRNNRVKEKEEE